MNAEGARIVVSPSADLRARWGRCWITARRAEDPLRPILLVVPELTVAGELTHPLLLGGEAVTEPATEAAAGEATAPGALFNVQRLTLELLARQLARDALTADRLAIATPLGLRAIVVRAIHDRLGMLRHYAAVARSPGFARCLGRTLAELRHHEVAPAALRALQTPAAQELALLLEIYEAALGEQRLVDRAGLLRLASEQPAGELIGGAAVLLFDLPLRYPLEGRLLAALAAQRLGLWVALPQGDQAARTVIEVALDRPATLLGAGSAGALARLQAGLFDEAEGAAEAPDPSGRSEVRIFSKASAERECTEIARRLLQLAERGLRADQMAVVVRQAGPYLDLLRLALQRAELPVYLASGARRPDPAGRAFVLLLQCALEGLPARRFAEYLSLGQTPAGEEEETIAVGQWERLLGEAAVSAGLARWRRRLAALARELDGRLTMVEADGALGRKLAYDLEQLQRLQAFALPLLERLTARPQQSDWGDWLDWLDPLAHHALRQPDRVLELLGELRPLATVGPVDLQQVVDTLADGLSELPQRPPAHRYGRVFLGTADDLRGLSFEAVFVAGVAERIFPAKVLQDPVLLDRAREQIERQRQRPGPRLATAGARRQRERCALQLAVGAARSAVTLSYPRGDLASGRPLVPSFYLLETLRAVEGSLPGFEELERRAAEQGALQSETQQGIERAIDAQEYDLALIAAADRRRREEPQRSLSGYAAHLHAHPTLIAALRTTWLRGLKRLTDADGLRAVGGAARAALERFSLRQRPTAVTDLERFARCPYQFYLYSVLRLRPSADLSPPLEGRLDPLTRGRLFHRAQFEIYRRLEREGALPLRPASLPGAARRLGQLFDEIAAAAAEQLDPPVLLHWQQEMVELHADLQQWLRREALSEAGYRPLRFEYAFGASEPSEARDARSVADPARVEQWLLRGAIDLVEVHRDGGLRVTDYKTGRAPQIRRRGLLAGGTSLQRVLYGMAYEALNPGVEVREGRLYYCTERGGFEQRRLTLDQPVRQQALQLLAFVDQAIRQGWLPAVPEPDCEGCDYRMVCGRDATGRWQRKQRGRRGADASLEQLERLRKL